MIEVDLCVYTHCPGLSMTVSFLVSFTNIANIHLLIHILLKYHIINLRWCHDFLITLVENFSNEKKLLNIALGEVSYLRTYYNRVVIYREKTIIKITRC